ncbi:MAG: hypothetical protein JWP44_511 [Mucilaginibacter sp.]|nr:hypothetical protein [Mucilaginibacter sp.]
MGNSFQHPTCKVCTLQARWFCGLPIRQMGEWHDVVTSEIVTLSYKISQNSEREMTKMVSPSHIGGRVQRPYHMLSILNSPPHMVRRGSP